MLFALLISIVLLCSISGAFAGDNETLDDVACVSEELDEISEIPAIRENLTSDSHDDVLKATNVINVHVKDTYDETSKTWDENGHNLAGAIVKLFDSSNKFISTYTTDSDGKVAIKNLNSNKYYLEISYSTYESVIDQVDFTNGNTASLEYMFVPDLLLLVDYSSHNEKVDLLMNMSKRIAYISTTDFDVGRSWLVDYAKYIHIDMFSEAAYSVLTARYLKDLLARSPANAKYNVAYTFGVYSDQILNNTGIHIVGASPSNNTYDTIENTYIGSYFQAQDIAESDILQKNIENYLNYVLYLTNPLKYDDPTLNPDNAPLMTPECGFYHPDLGIYTIRPNGNLINQWIHDNPGYTHSSDGSLNWMIENYCDWVVNELNPTELFKKFEQDYITKFNLDEKFIAIATYYCSETVTDALIRSYEANGRPAFNIFKTGTQPAMSSILNKINNVTEIGISAVVSLYSWSLSYANGSAESDLSEIDLQILKGVHEISEYSYNSDLGPQIEWTYAVTYPSFEGVFGPIILSYVDGNGKTHVIQSGVDKMVKLSCGWANLKEMNNSDKKIAIVLYNYPPGKAEIGASYLDVFTSTYDLLMKLYDQGYDIGCTPEDFMSVRNLTDLIVEFGNKGTWAQGLLNEYVEKYWDELNKHNQLINLNEFYDLTSDVNLDLYLEMIDYWGDGLGKIMIYNNTYMVIPGLWFGNVFVTFQPSRGWEEVKNYHDLTLPPHQQYVAFYKWLDKRAGIDAIVNMGTHGTLEWLPGTNLGSYEDDWTFELTLTPTVYPYIVSNPGEAMVARDRIAALLITHMTPAMVSSELYGNYTVLLNYITSYKDQVKLNVSTNAEYYKNKIIELAPALGFKNISANESFSDWLDDLHRYLDVMENDFNTYGLHTLGKVLNGYELIEEVITIITSQTKVYDLILKQLYPNLANLSYYEDIQNNLDYLNESSEIKAFLKAYITDLVNGSSIDELSSKYSVAKDSGLYNLTGYFESVIVNICNNNEWNAILIALSGGYLKAGLFADPSYGDSIPTGYDGYASDSTKMPSKAAYESAVNIVDLLLANYYEQHGKWPELTSLILWGTEISRTEGIGVAEFLYFLGCKPRWADNGKVIGVDMLPLSDLTVKLNNGTVVNRPRIDVFASIVTSNKDWLTWMLTAVKYAAGAPGEDETNNYVKKHYAENPTLDRLFGLPGNILEGTGMSTLIPNTADWNISTVNQYASDIYMNKVSYSWTLDEKGNIVITKQKDTYEYLLTNVDLITQNFDSTWRFLDSDDYYDWFGGMKNAADIFKTKAGKEKADTQFVDIRNKNNYYSRTYEEELDFEVRSMILNPKYYLSLINSDGGALAYSSKMQNLYAGLVVGGAKLDSNLGNQIASTYLDIAGSVDSVSKAAAWQSMAAWMVYLDDQGLWDGDKNLVSEMANSMIQMAPMYGVACCHHTCANLEFNMKLIMKSTLSAQEKQKYMDTLSKATLDDSIYDMINPNQNQNNPSQNPNDNNGEHADDVNNNQNANVLANGTVKDSKNSDNVKAGGKTAVGDDYSNDPDNAKVDPVTSELSSAESEGAGSSEAGGVKAYELNQQSTSKSIPTESSMPIFVIIAIIFLIAIFLVGYLRKDNDEYDDY